MKLGDKLNFNFAKGKNFEVKEIIEKANLPLSWDWDRGICPHCNEKIIKTVDYTIDRVVIIEEPDGDIVSIGYTKELIGKKPLTLRLPDKDFYVEKDMTKAIEAQSTYLTDLKKEIK